MRKLIIYFLIFFSFFYYWENIKEHLFIIFDLFWSLEVIYRVLIVGVLVYIGSIKNFLKGVYNENSKLINSLFLILVLSFIGINVWGYEDLRNIIIAIGIVGFVWIAMLFNNE